MSDYTDSGCVIKYPHSPHPYTREGKDWRCGGVKFINELDEKPTFFDPEAERIKRKVENALKTVGCENINVTVKEKEIEGMGPDQPTIVNEQGAGQSDIPYRFDLVDGNAMFKMSKVLAEGANKYGANNWRKIPVEDHLNHLIAHAYAYLSGDQSDFHLSHIMCRAMFAQGVNPDD